MTYAPGVAADPAAEQLTGEDIVEIEEVGYFRKAIPSMSVGLAWACLFFNLIFPGFGTFISSFAALNGAPTGYKTQKAKATGVNLLAALLQLLTAPLIIGFIWSLMWGMSFVNVARSASTARSSS